MSRELPSPEQFKAMLLDPETQKILKNPAFQKKLKALIEQNTSAPPSDTTPISSSNTTNAPALMTQLPQLPQKIEDFNLHASAYFLWVFNEIRGFGSDAITHTTGIDFTRWYYWIVVNSLVLTPAAIKITSVPALKLGEYPENSAIAGKSIAGVYFMLHATTVANLGVETAKTALPYLPNAVSELVSSSPLLKMSIKTIIVVSSMRTLGAITRNFSDQYQQVFDQTVAQVSPEQLMQLVLLLGQRAKNYVTVHLHQVAYTTYMCDS